MSSSPRVRSGGPVVVVVVVAVVVVVDVVGDVAAALRGFMVSEREMG